MIIVNILHIFCNQIRLHKTTKKFLFDIPKIFSYKYQEILNIKMQYRRILKLKRNISLI